MRSAMHGAVDVACVIRALLGADRKSLRFRPHHGAREYEIGGYYATLELSRTSLVVVVEHLARLRVEKETRSGFLDVTDVRLLPFPGNSAII